MRTRHLSAAVAALGMLCFGGPYAIAGSHTWDVNELFSNASGTIQFIELRETMGGPGEVGVGGHLVTSNTKSFLIANSVAAPTSFKFLLFATAGFAALPGAPTPDQIMPDNFFSVNGDTITYSPWDSMVFGPGVLPTDGVRSLNEPLTVAPNSPTNYAGQTGSVNANPPAAPPGVPDGEGGSTPMTAVANDQAASSLSVSWDTATCSNATSHHIIYGQKSDLPAVPGGDFRLSGAACGIGGTSPYLWSPAPEPTDGLGLIWWLIVTDDGTTEGPWGNGSNGVERIGPGPDGSSGLCGVTTKNVTNVCGH